MAYFAKTLATLEAKTIAQIAISSDLMVVAVFAEDPALLALASEAFDAAIESQAAIGVAVAGQLQVHAAALAARVVIGTAGVAP